MCLPFHYRIEDGTEIYEKQVGSLFLSIAVLTAQVL